MTDIKISDSTPVAMLTVGQLKELFQNCVKELLSAANVAAPCEESSKRYVYGIAGIASLFNVSYVTACKLKDGILQPAILQQGRKIMCDAELAIELFRNKAEKKSIT